MSETVDDTYIVGYNESLVHDVVDVLYDVTDGFRGFVDGSSFIQCHTEVGQLLQATHTHSSSTAILPREPGFD